MNKLRVLDLFSGIGGFSLGLERTGGFETAAFCEYAEFPRKVLAKHWPDVPIYPDIRELTAERLDADGLGPVDLICGGYPCQPFSHAGKRLGAEDDRHLWPEMRRLVETLRPAWVIGENVAGHVSMGLDDVLSDLGALGYACQAFVIPACAVNAPHRRDRVWLVAHSDHAIQPASARRGEDDWHQPGNDLGRCGEVVSYATGAGFSERRRSGRQTRTAEEGTGLVAQPQRCGEAVANAIGIGIGRCSRNGEWQDAIHADTCGETVGAGTDGSWWAVEPDVGRVVARFSSWLDGGVNANAAQGGTAKILWALREQNAAQHIKWPSRGHGSVQEAEILLSYLCQYQGAPRSLGNVSLAGKEASPKVVRGVWFNGKAACTSCRRSASEQRQVKHPDFVRLLSQLLACDCRATWLDPTGTPSDASRADRLKALGNAVVPQIPEMIGHAILQSMKEAA
jgi:DNA (cytosine-5)-methyltransferase 1